MVDGETVSEDEAARRALERAQQDAASGRLASAEARYRDLLDAFPDTDSVPAALDALARLKLTQSGCDAARLYDERLIEAHSKTEEAKAARARRAECEPEMGPEPGPKTTLRAEFETARSDAEKKAIASRGADLGLAAGDALEALRWLYEVHRLERDPAQLASLEEEIRTLARERISARGLRVLIEELDSDDYLVPELTFRLGAIQLHVGDVANGRQTLDAFAREYTGGPLADRARGLLGDIDRRSNVNPRRVGLLLPLSGRHRSYGELALKAVRMAVPENAGPFEFVVRDTESEAATAARQAEALILEDQVIGILGPIFTYEARQAGLEAERLGAPLLTISPTDDLADIGPHVFQNGLTNQAQAEALVAYTMDVLGMKRFAVVYPEHPYGEELLNLFWDEVTKRNGEIRGVEAYGLQDTTFSRQIKSLVARDDPERRPDFREATKACEEQPDSFRVARCKERARKSLKPIIDFDGLFIPDYPRSISMIAAALAFEDVIVEQDPRRLRTIERTLGRDVTPITLLGASGWNSQKLIDRAERTVENAIFTDGFFADAEDPATVDFVNRYREQHGRTPRLYPEALFYDSAHILKGIFESKPPATRAELREALSRIHDFEGVTGTTSFRQGNDAEKSVRILTIKDGIIREAPPDGPVEDAEDSESATP